MNRREFILTTSAALLCSVIPIPQAKDEFIAFNFRRGKCEVFELWEGLHQHGKANPNDPHHWLFRIRNGVATVCEGKTCGRDGYGYGFCEERPITKMDHYYIGLMILGDIPEEVRRNLYA